MPDTTKNTRIELTQEQLENIDKLYREACEKIAKLESIIEEKEKTSPVLSIGDSIWCILDLKYLCSGKITLKDMYLDIPILRKVDSIAITDRGIYYHLIDPKYNILDRTITKENLGETAFRSYKDAYAQILKNQNTAENIERSIS